MAIADMFLKMTGITGEAQDSGHKGEIQVVGWSWGLAAPTDVIAAGVAVKRAATVLRELVISKRVDLATPSLMGLLRANKIVTSAVLTVRKAGTTPYEYFKIELSGARVISVTTHSEAQELYEQVSFTFQRVRVTYSPQQSGTGAKGGGDVTFEADAYSAG